MLNCGDYFGVLGSKGTFITELVNKERSPHAHLAHVFRTINELFTGLLRTRGVV